MPCSSPSHVNFRYGIMSYGTSIVASALMPFSERVSTRGSRIQTKSINGVKSCGTLGRRWMFLGLDMETLSWRPRELVICDQSKPWKQGYVKKLLVRFC